MTWTTRPMRPSRMISPAATIHLAWYAEPRAYLRAVPENLASLRGGIKLSMRSA